MSRSLTDQSLTEASRETWERILQRGFKYPVLTARIDFSEDEVELGTNDFVFLMMEFAEEAGIDLKEFGRRLVGDGVREDRLIFYPGVALRTVFEVEGHYVEFPNAYALYKVPKQALIVIGAALIGMAAGKVTEIDPVVGGALTGVGGLLKTFSPPDTFSYRTQRTPKSLGLRSSCSRCWKVGESSQCGNYRSTRSCTGRRLRKPWMAFMKRASLKGAR